MPAQYPSFNDREFDLLKKMVENTAELADGTGIPLTVAEANLLYFRLDGTNGSLTDGRVVFAGTGGALDDDSAFTFNSGTGQLTATSFALGLTTPGVVSGDSGAITLTAGSTDKNITLTPTTTGYILSNLWGNPVPDAPASGTMLNIVGRSGNNNLTVLDSFGSESAIMARRYNGTFGSLTGLLANQTIFRIRAFGYNGSAMVGTRAQIAMDATENWSTTANGTKIVFYTTPTGSTSFGNVSQYEGYGRFTLSPASGTMAAWGTQGALVIFSGSTITDTTSSGTVATAVARAIQGITIAASSASTYTNAASLYLSAAPSAGTNVTITNSYALWNAAGTKLDGSLVLTPQLLSGAGAINTTTPSTEYTSTGGAQALTLANGEVGQIKTIVHTVDGGSGVLTPATAIGFTTITFTNVGDSVTLQYTTTGWAIVGVFGAVAA